MNNKKQIPEKPEELLYQYQLDIVQDPSRFKILSCSRQIGKSTMLAYEAVADCMMHAGAQWIAVSASRKQAYEWLKKAQKWAKAFELYLAAEDIPVKITRVTQSELEFSNGSKITALPPNPDTIRGYSANVILDEFAYYENADEVWAAVLPSISSETSGRKLKIRIASTVAGKGNKFWEILDGSNDDGYLWSKHVVTIENAVQDGLPMDIEELKKGVADDDIWSQEYMCIPADASYAVFPYETIDACVDRTIATERFDPKELEFAGSEFFIGVDIARVQNLTVIYVLKIGIVGNEKKLITREIRELPHIALHEQEKIIAGYIKNDSVKRCYLDSTGIGKQMAEDLVRQFGSKVVAYDFTVDSKRDLFVKMQDVFQTQGIVIPGGNALREDLHAMQRVHTKSGNILYTAPMNKAGHSDRATACALAVMAAKVGGEPNYGVWTPGMDFQRFGPNDYERDEDGNIKTIFGHPLIKRDRIWKLSDFYDYDHPDAYDARRNNPYLSF